MLVANTTRLLDHSSTSYISLLARVRMVQFQVYTCYLPCQPSAFLPPYAPALWFNSVLRAPAFCAPTYLRLNHGPSADAFLLRGVGSAATGFATTPRYLPYMPTPDTRFAAGPSRPHLDHPRIPSTTLIATHTAATTLDWFTPTARTFAYAAGWFFSPRTCPFILFLRLVDPLPAAHCAALKPAGTGRSSTTPAKHGWFPVGPGLLPDAYWRLTT